VIKTIKISFPYVKLVQISSVEGIATQHKKTSKVLTRVTPVPENASLQYKTLHAEIVSPVYPKRYGIRRNAIYFDLESLDSTLKLFRHLEKLAIFGPDDLGGLKFLKDLFRELGKHKLSAEWSHILSTKTARTVTPCHTKFTNQFPHFFYKNVSQHIRKA
jgi:hypothetical protein